MGRRLAIVMVAVVAGALVFAGLGSLLLARQSTVQSDVTSLKTQATKIADALATRENNGTVNPRRIVADGQFLAQVTTPFLTRVTFLLVQSDGAVTTPAALDKTVTAADRLLVRYAEPESAALLAGDVVSGSSGTFDYAIAPLDLDTAVAGALSLPAGSRIAIAVLTSVKLPTYTGAYFLVTGAISLVVAVIVAWLAAARVARPLTLAVRTTRRIAAGDLDARMPVERTYPELAQLGESINTMAEELARSRATERQFVLSISHDLRTPLTSIRGYAEAIADGAAPDPVRAATVIASEARRLERLFQDLLDLARLDARRFAIDVRRVELAEVAAAAADGMRIRFEEAGLSLDVQAPAGDLAVAADPDRLAQVITNLLENARRFASTRARVAAMPIPTEPGVLAVVVEDDGPGIPAADLPHVFERFYTGGVRDRARTGTGLGLAIVSELVQAMGGTVDAVSPATPAGAGTRVVVRLRRWTGGGPPPAPPPPAPPPSAAAGADPRSR
jgi:signal transduction histidine kinase